MVQPRAADSNHEVCSFLHPCYTWVTYHHQFLGLLNSFLSAPLSQALCYQPLAWLIFQKHKSRPHLSSLFNGFSWLWKPNSCPLLLCCTIWLQSIIFVPFLMAEAEHIPEMTWGEGCILSSVPLWRGSYVDSNTSAGTHESTRQLVTWQQFTRTQRVGDWKAGSG